MAKHLVWSGITRKPHECHYRQCSGTTIPGDLTVMESRRVSYPNGKLFVNQFYYHPLCFALLLRDESAAKQEARKLRPRRRVHTDQLSLSQEQKLARKKLLNRRNYLFRLIHAGTSDRLPELSSEFVAVSELLSVDLTKSHRDDESRERFTGNLVIR